jgi:hypothetical protein
MNNLQLETEKLAQNHIKITPAFVCVKLKVTPQHARELCEYVWIKTAREYFIWRCFGKTEKEFYDSY